MANKKYNITLIKEYFKKEGYTLLSTEYEGYTNKLDYRCPRGHYHSITWGNWLLGHRCRFCNFDKRKLSLDKIREAFYNEGYTLLTTVYKNNKQKLEYICPKGHKHSIRWDDWASGNRCYYCHGNLKPSFDTVRNSLEKEGYILLSEEYKNSSTKLDYICPNKHSHSITYRDWVSGCRCPYCVGNNKKTIEYIKEEFKKEGYILLSKKYENAHIKLEYVCSEGHGHSITWGNWRTGYRCPTCKGINLSITRCGSGHPNWQGGKSFEPYCEAWKDKEYKQDIRNRDDNKCLNPYCNSSNKNDLTIHHIDYNKKNCKPSNLITVCRSCNSKANKDRTWHKSWYQALLYRRYDYRY